MYVAQKSRLLVLLVSCIISFESCFAIPEEARSKGFVYLHEIDPSILISLRYYGSENFVASPVDGYKKPVVILTRQAAEALKRVQKEVGEKGYSLVVYDAYRPQQAVDHFMRWSEAVADQAKKNQYYPRVNKAEVFDLGYVAKKSGHSRGSTVDLTIIANGQGLHGIQEKERVLSDGYRIKILDDGTVDMGSSFDLFDRASHFENELIQDEHKALRAYLKTVMEKHGFKNYSEEWWHFTLRNELFPANQDSSYFNFPIE
jgi:D-alanyl-D-alanine dipeptidase